LSFAHEAFDAFEAAGGAANRPGVEAVSGVAELLAEARSGIRRYRPAEALARAAAGSTFVDLRSHDERERDGVIPGSVHVPRSVLEWRVDERSGFSNPHVAQRELELVLVCNEGYSSSFAAAALRELGFSRAGDLAGGFQAWRAAGLPTMPAPPPAAGLPGMGGLDR
jgi:rhodanese-related sulfurtransferase